MVESTRRQPPVLHRAAVKLVDDQDVVFRQPVRDPEPPFVQRHRRRERLERESTSITSRDVSSRPEAKDSQFDSFVRDRGNVKTFERPISRHFLRISLLE